METTLYHDDCLAIMPTLADSSIDLILTDPPYFEIKGEFDWHYKDFKHYLEFIEQCAVEWERILKKSGSLYVFAHAKRVAYIQVILDKYFNLESHLKWEKPDIKGRAYQKVVRSFQHLANEHILFYSREVERTGLEEIKLDTDNFTTLRGYFKQVQNFIGNGKNTIIARIGQKADHCFRHSSTQWDLPTAETYAQLITVFSIDKMPSFREYESLRQEYESLCQEYESLRQEYESLRRPFKNIHSLTDVIKHSQEAHITKLYNHDTVKPVGLIAKLIETSSNENDTVLDCFMGSGTTGHACALLNRNFIGIEKDYQYFAIAEKRIKDASHNLINLFCDEVA
jgi:adenine-specific DNA-methyltransferase